MKEGEKEGLRSAARFAIQPNMWGFCGEDSSQEILRGFVSERDVNFELVKETLCSHGFPHLNAFLGAISINSGRSIFDSAVVMSYWFGGDLTETSSRDSGAVLAKEYAVQISDDFAGELVKRLPKEIYLTHLTQVALVAAADYDQLEKSKLINQCMVAYGKIISIDKENKMAVVDRDILKKNEGTGYEVFSDRQRVRIDPDLTPSLEIGNDIAVHLGYLAARLAADQTDRLRYWTRKVAEII